MGEKKKGGNIIFYFLKHHSGEKTQWWRQGKGHEQAGSVDFAKSLWYLGKNYTLRTLLKNFASRDFVYWYSPAPHPLAFTCWQGPYELVERINSEDYMTYDLVKKKNIHCNPFSLTCLLELTQDTLVTSSPELLCYVTLWSPYVVSVFHYSTVLSVPGIRVPSCFFHEPSNQKTPFCLTLFSPLHWSGSGSCSYISFSSSTLFLHHLTQGRDPFWCDAVPGPQIPAAFPYPHLNSSGTPGGPSADSSCLSGSSAPSLTLPSRA